MTDAESFYLVLALFYIIERVRFQSPGTTAVENLWGLTNGWKPKKEFSRFLGIKKWLFLSPILPWPGQILFLKPSSIVQGGQSTSPSVPRARELLRLLEKTTHPLKYLSALIFCYFFVVLPYLYHLQRGKPEFMVSIAVGYFLMVSTGIGYFKAHKKWFPRKRGARMINTIYTVLLPWHSMKCSEDIAQSRAGGWGLPVLLAAKNGSPDCLKLLQTLWREAHYLSAPAYSASQLQKAVQGAGLDSSDWLSPSRIKGDKYCPCCFAPYESEAILCGDCPQVKLVSNSD